MGPEQGAGAHLGTEGYMRSQDPGQPWRKGPCRPKVTFPSRSLQSPWGLTEEFFSPVQSGLPSIKDSSVCVCVTDDGLFPWEGRDQRACKKATIVSATLTLSPVVNGSRSPGFKFTFFPYMLFNPE